MTVSHDDLLGKDPERSDAALALSAEAHEAVSRLVRRRPELLGEALDRLRASGVAWDGEPSRTLPVPWSRAALHEAVPRWAHILRLAPDDAAAWIVAFDDDFEMNASTPFELNAPEVRAEITRLRREGKGRIHENTKAESRLAQLRLERDLTQSEMSRRTGLDSMTYWRLERKRIRNPPIGYLAVCADALGVSLDELLEDEYLTWRPRKKG